MNYKKPVSPVDWGDVTTGFSTDLRQKATIESLVSRLDALEAREKELAEALLDYVIADLAEPWVPAARRLEAVLVARLKK